MIKMRSFLVLALTAILAFGVFAQDEPETVEFPEDLTGNAVQLATSGTLVENDDDTYTLTLSGVADFVPMVFLSPDFYVSNYSTLNFVGDWATYNGNAEEAVVVTAMLQIGSEKFAKLTVPVTIAPESITAYDDGTVTYIVTIDMDGIYSDDPEADSKDLELPEEFEVASLVIKLDAVVISAFFEGQLAAIADGRVTGAVCNPYVSKCS